jgi:hypothetical protein
VAETESTYQKYQAPPSTPVDFKAKKIRDTELVKMLESFYTTAKPPTKSYAMSAEDVQSTEDRIAYLKELHVLHQEFLPVLQAEIDFQQNNRTTADTTMVDMQMNYPLIHEEIENELEARQFFKDTGIGKAA